ncbi:MAG: serine/threonine protein kinase [Gordonia sp.]|jgi:serine/threonine-protein kinase|uniref:serine/threonine-protein kinase n=1 Tax=Gordonia sp. (in: high G+C Gram-positive bacteria) TaxID=84139 RepID=UPI001D7221CC|nr:serine/threonine-protein kinase [Gordonia sp. (in: high G+C Gram-positive bacteria)]MCB1295417.1 serine/threonine protein kinase [Gordonia sp. (in: high G+C Gram-positive bacteria)]
MTLSNGTTIADRYRLMRLIATGGMGQVWEALDTRLNRRVAVKVLKAEYTNDPEFTARFRSEAQVTAMLNNPGIANVFDYGETPDRGTGEPLAYLVMELVDGEPLNSVISRMGRLSLANSLDMLEQTGRALQAAHDQGLVHRDVKPGNILITPTGQVKITDFGIAKAVDAAPVTQTGMVMGTAQYISPEQATGDEATSASDVYALGVVGYEALTGRRPFLGDGAITVAMKHIRETPPPLPSNLPSGVRELIEITMAKDPRQRYANGGEFADAVAAVRAGRRPPRPGSNTATSTINPTPRPTAATRVIGTGPATSAPYSPSTSTYTGPNYAAPRPPQRPSTPDNTWTTGQKVLAALAGILLLIALGVVGFWLANADSNTGDPKTPASTVTTTTEDTAPTTTTQDQEPTGTDDEPTTQETEEDTRPTRTTTADTTTGTPTGETTTTGATTTQDTATEDPGNGGTGAGDTGNGDTDTATEDPGDGGTGAGDTGMGDDGAGDTVPEGQGNGGGLTISIPGLPTFP